MSADSRIREIRGFRPFPPKIPPDSKKNRRFPRFFKSPENPRISPKILPTSCNFPGFPEKSLLSGRNRGLMAIVCRPTQRTPRHFSRFAGVFFCASYSTGEGVGNFANPDYRFSKIFVLKNWNRKTIFATGCSWNNGGGVSGVFMAPFSVRK